MSGVPQPIRRRRYEWCRLRNDFPDMPIWRAVASRAKAPVSSVVAVAVRLECLANRSVPRGLVADMSVPEFAASLQLRPDVVARIRAALEDPDISWIDQDFIVDFHQRNPDHDDQTAAARQARRRAKLKVEREHGSARSPPTTYPQSRDVTRDSVTVTARSDQIKKEDGLSDESAGFAVAVTHTSTVESGESQELRCLRVVVECLEVNTTSAQLKLERWKRELGGDDDALARIVDAAEATNLRGARFHNLVTDQVARHRHQVNGPQLPLMPPRPKGRAHG